MIGWISRFTSKRLAPKEADASKSESEISNQLYRDTISAPKQNLFDYQLSKGVSPTDAFKLLAGADYAAESGNFVRTFAAIEVMLLAISISVDSEIGDEYAFSFKARLKEATEKVTASNASDEDKQALLAQFEIVKSISELRHRMMHWMLHDIPLPGKPYVFRNFSHRPLSRGMSETAEYSRSELASAVKKADQALTIMSDFLKARAALNATQASTTESAKTD